MSRQPAPHTTARPDEAPAQRPVVIKVGGTTVEDRVSAPKLWNAIAQLARTRPGGVVLVHGGGKAVDRHLDRLGVVTQRRDGIRLTPPEQLDEIVAVLAGRVNKSIVAGFHALALPAVGLCLGDGDAIPTRKNTRYDFDPGRVGEIVEIQDSPGERSAGRLLSLLLREGFLPVLSSIGIDTDGFLNVNADDAAAGVARVLRASALVLMTDVPGILDAQRRLVPEIDRAGIERMIEIGEITGGMIVKARAAAQTAASLGAPVVILSGSDADALAAWCAGQHAGTSVLPR